MKTVGLVIARQGSKRIEGKNERDFCGHPLVAWSILQSLCTHGIDGTFLSTDGDNLAAIGKEYGAEIIRRPEWDDADYVPANIPYMHMLQILKEVFPEVQTAVMYLPTSPLRKPDDTDRCLKAFYETTPWPGRATQLIPIVPQPETIVHGIMERGYAYWKLWDKHWSYAVQGGGMSLWNIQDYITLNETIVRERWTDDMIDNLADKVNDYYNRDITHTDILRYIPFQIWQQFELDVPEQWKMCEAIMEGMILKGKGTDVYSNYAKEKANVTES